MDKYSLSLDDIADDWYWYCSRRLYPYVYLPPELEGKPRFSFIWSNNRIIVWEDNICVYTKKQVRNVCRYMLEQKDIEFYKTTFIKKCT